MLWHHPMHFQVNVENVYCEGMWDGWSSSIVVFHNNDSKNREWTEGGKQDIYTILDDSTTA